jgi:phosphoglycerate dehydrogenase-like enzyme
VSRPLVIFTEQLDRDAEAWLRERCDVEACPVADGARLRERLREARGLIVRTYTRVDASLLDAAPRLKVVGRAGVGLDNIDVAECRRRGIGVVHTPDANGDAVAEYVFAMLLAEVRPMRYFDAAMEAEAWHALRRRAAAPRQVREMTLGILGLGRIGQRVARIARGFEMPVVYHDLVEIAEAKRHGAIPVSREEVFARADVLTIHVDHRASNRHLINAASLALMKPEVILINTSRGMVVDRMALAGFLRRNADARAMLDVHEPEPIDPANPLLGMANAKLAPHLAAATRLAHSNMSWVVRDVWRVLNGEKAECAAGEPGE